MRMSETTEPAIAEPTSQQLNKACEPCRLMKVRCIMDPLSSSIQCQRCLKSNRRCFFAAVQRRKPRKPTDIRIAELEKEVEAMRSLLYKTRSSSLNSSSSTEKNEQSRTKPTVDSGHSEHGDDIPNQHAQICTLPSISPIYTDVIDRGIISMTQAEHFVQVYIDTLLNLSPFIPTSEYQKDLNQFRREKPILFLSILYTSSVGIDPPLSVTFNTELLRVLADRVFIKAEKSIEIIQALIIVVLFHVTSEASSNINCYQHTHTAATMAVELGLASAPSRPSLEDDRENAQVTPLSEDDIEGARIILVCYNLTAGMAMRLRRPNMLPWNSWMDQCSEHLVASNNPMDKHIVSWAKLQRILEETAIAIGFDEASQDMPVTDGHVQFLLRSFEKRLGEWDKEHGNISDPLNVAAVINHQLNSTSVYEFIMLSRSLKHTDSKWPFFSPRAIDDLILDMMANKQKMAPLNALQLSAALKCISTASTIFEDFSLLNPDILRLAPNILYVRLTYGFLVLIRITIVFRRSGWIDSIPPLDGVIKSQLTMTMRQMEFAAQPKGYPRPLLWLSVLIRVKQRFDGYLSGLDIAAMDYSQSEPGQQTPGVWSSTSRAVEHATVDRDCPVSVHTAPHTFASNDLRLFDDVFFGVPGPLDDTYNVLGDMPMHYTDWSI